MHSLYFNTVCVANVCVRLSVVFTIFIRYISFLLLLLLLYSPLPNLGSLHRAIYCITCVTKHSHSIHFSDHQIELKHSTRISTIHRSTYICNVLFRLLLNFSKFNYVPAKVACTACHAMPCLASYSNMNGKKKL